ncbi:MAG: L-glutamine synthetase [Candidatus Roizmanbacteria bacterium GW2011_GWA2_35_19]|uniref:L-glutamine synthetase n=2 Tax=Candidatus Roizmaniibacteriota TaxID=1752723 RepID=A0A0G0BTR4_9BACT|nr:MAG: L-glutamine synthetase [Candidatus Roizmanbacteria bacterium GW2011_GWC2_35_12]KKP72698.1 MAG: L-glutamine synthetase [Candidatus Roizmanbacteria bacterium GW2011_GWA2_35_19]
MAQQALPVMYDAQAINSGLTPAGEVFMRADWDTLKSLPYSPGHARVYTNTYNAGKQWTQCPRSFLKKVIKKAEEYNLRIKAAFENEFYLLKLKDGIMQLFDQSLFAQTYALDNANLIIKDITDALSAQSVYPEMLYAESGSGQFEIPVRYTDTLAAADQQITFRETVRGVTQKFDDVIASFVPKIFSDKAGSGAHLHFSLWENEKNITADFKDIKKISAKAQSFIAGILFHLPALMCLTTPTANSFKRIKPRFWSGTYKCWGYGNREAAIRIPETDDNNPITNIELKTVDPTCNPYLALGAVITAGLDGLEKKMKLGDSVNKDPADLTKDELHENNINLLPSNLGLAIEHLRKDKTILDMVGSDLAKSFLAVRDAEWLAMKDFSVEQEAKLLLERY